MSNQLKTFNKLIKVSVISVVLLLTACGSDVVVNTALNNTRDVKEGADVFLGQKIVGEVTDVTHSDGQTLLVIELDETFAAEVKQNAAVVVNRLKANSPLEIYNQKNSTESIQNGQELKGLDSMFQLGAWMVGDSLEIGADSLTGYVDAFQKYLKGDAWQQDKKNITEQAQQAAVVAGEAVKQATEEMEKMTSELGKVEGEVAAAVEQMGNELAPVFGELAKSGQSIVQELEKFTHNLENKKDQEKAVGEDFIQSLEKALEALNKSMEEGVESSQLRSEQPTVPEATVNNGIDELADKQVEASIEASEKIAEDMIQEANKNKAETIVAPIDEKAPPATNDK